MKIKVLISGGGTGGHVYPAISIADAVRKRMPEAEFLFVGANGKIEMTKVPQAGYEIRGLDIAGFERKLTLKNFKVLWLLFKSLLKARKILKDFKPNVVVGVGGYASGPIGFWANRMNIPVVLQEQNSYAGVTNKLLAKGAEKICVAYENMERFFPKEKIVVTGNPIRTESFVQNNKQKAYQYFHLDSQKQTVCIIGGSLGARSINNAVLDFVQKNIENIEYQFIWQTGKLYYESIMEKLADKQFNPKLVVKDFINRMDYLFTVADVIVSRAGAGTISELCLVGKPVILVPSPNVAEDHQTQNALALVKNNAAIMVKDNELNNSLFDEVENLLKNKEKQKNLSENIKKMAKPNAANQIAEIILEVAK